MYSHTTVGANDLARAKDFYDAVLEPLGLEVRFSGGGIIGWGLPGARPQFLVVRPFDGGDPSVGNGSMIALLAEKRSIVDACYAAAMAQGGLNEGAPGLRPQYHRNYYGAYFRDLDGNKICVVCHQSE
ncbi:VOC family protein [Microvirga zambiensis]|uniref:VOC family protein n=1 Tax=Microvirga zambiensis TaxID=1402137 RepID=UPI00191FEC6D|nr:VOC family protein [Microvirga zambiensis]